MRKMKGLHDSTVSIYVNSTICIVMFFATYALGYDMQIFHNLEPLDWLLFFLIGLVNNLAQMARFIAIKYDEPGKVSHYSYILSIY